MILFSDPSCLEYGRPGHLERPQRISASRAYLEKTHPNWRWAVPVKASVAEVERVHSERHLERFSLEADFDADTPWFPGILDHALRAAGGAIGAMQAARSGEKAFSLLRPPGHHALAERAMGFCYLNSVVIAAHAALADGVKKVGIWDFDAHYGNGTEALVARDERIVFASVHQHPGWPGGGAESSGNVKNYPVSPLQSREFHMQELRKSLDALLEEKPELLLISAGFDAYVDDPITEMRLLAEDFGEIGRWLHAVPLPTACILEGGYSEALPELIGGFLEKWENE